MYLGDKIYIDGKLYQVDKIKEHLYKNKYVTIDFTNPELFRAFRQLPYGAEIVMINSNGEISQNGDAFVFRMITNPNTSKDFRVRKNGVTIVFNRMFCSKKYSYDLYVPSKQLIRKLKINDICINI
jgi:hypothetical protein